MRSRVCVNMPFSFAAAVALFASCSPAELPIMSRDIADGYDLTSPYYVAGDPGPPLPSFDMNVNPVGVSIKNPREESNGLIYITLSGTNVENGIPDGLHAVYYPAKNVPPPPPDVLISTDYVMTGEITALPVDRSKGLALEDCIALKSVSKNSKYTVVTISGMVEHSSFVRIEESNESLRLLTDNYIWGYNAPSAAINPSVFPMWRDRLYYNDPNLFSESGFDTRDRRIFRGSQEQGGGFNVLIWDGASPKIATFSISYDKGRTFKRTVIDWSAVRFSSVDLLKVVWKALDKDTAKIVYYPTGAFDQPSTEGYWELRTPPSPPPPPDTYETATALLKPYPREAKDPPRGSIVEGFQPTFLPANATARNFYYEDAGQKNYSGIYDDGNIRIEIADRIKASAKHGATGGTASVTFAIDLATVPPTAVTIKVNAKIDGTTSP